MDKKKRNIITVALLTVLAAALLIGGTLSYFTDEEEITNTLKVGKVDVDIEEPEWEDGDGDNLVPGETLIKDPLVTALEGPMYMRLIMKIQEQNADGSSGEFITDPDRLALIMQTLYLDKNYGKTSSVLDTESKYFQSELQELIEEGEIYSITNTEIFRPEQGRQGNGSYYYNYVANDGKFSPGEKVYFMSHLIVPADWGIEEIELLGNYNITFKVQAIQYDSFTTMTEAMEALDQEAAKLEENGEG